MTSWGPPESWRAPAEPGPEVTHVYDSRNVVWRREGGLWWADIGHGYEVHRTWWELLSRGTLTNVSREHR